MYILIPTGQNQIENQSYTGFMDAINILSFFVGLANMDLNVTANDLAEQKNYIVNDFHSVMKKLDKHLEAQDKHLEEQDARLFLLEKYLYENYDGVRKESSK